ncbi:hypothetical protein [Paenibacillus hamazuiensis]|nr:hypothetical protein [Paenibacillus hamazuiensis]
MSDRELTPEDRYAEIARQMLEQDPHVSSDTDRTKKRFGMSG